MMYWHTVNRLKNDPGFIVEVDGHTFSRPMPIIERRREVPQERRGVSYGRRWNDTP